MNANATRMPFQTSFRPDLTLKRRIISAPLESDSTNPFEGESTREDAGLKAGWDKLYRARALLEAEQAHVRDDRIALQGEAEALVAREQALAVREQRILGLEAHAKQLVADAEERDSQSPFARLSRVFGRKE